MGQETGSPTPQSGSQGDEKGKPSSQMQRLMATAAAQEAMSGADDDYTFVTDAKPEQGIFRIVGGYIDEKGELHDEVHLRAMGGEEEEILGDDRGPFMMRMNTILSRCLQRIGSIDDPSMMFRIVNSLPSGSRTDLMIYLRLVSHWKSTGDVYDMKMRCPDKAECGQESNHKINLLELERYQPEDITTRVHTIKLEDAGFNAVWQWMNGDMDHVLDIVSTETDYRREYLTYAIAVRLLELDGQRKELSPYDVLTRNKKRLKPNPKTKNLLKILKAMSVHDRGALRADFIDKEPGVDTDIIFECPHCGLNFEGRLRVGQSSFFFPQETSKRSRRRRST